MLNEIQTTTLRNREMPIKMPTTKAGKREAVHTVMKEFGSGKLHSGSKTGPKVTNPRQAVAIAMSESGQSKKMGPVKTPPPDHAKNPGDYDDSAHRRSYATDKSTLGEPGKPKGSAEGVEIGPAIHRDREAGSPHTFDRPSARESHGYGHGVHQRSGALRLSGARNAHRIGK